MSLIIAFLILVLSFPVGYLVKYFTKEELKSGKKYFQITWIICLVLAIVMLFYPISDVNYKQSLIFGLLFIANIAFISWK